VQEERAGELGVFEIVHGDEHEIYKDRCIERVLSLEIERKFFFHGWRFGNQLFRGGCARKVSVSMSSSNFFKPSMLSVKISRSTDCKSSKSV